MESDRAKIVTRRTYNRPKNDEGTVFESWEETVDRVISHQVWLWERARGVELGEKELEELDELKEILLTRKACPAGRTLWLGGTEVARKCESSMFNPLPPDTRFITSKGVRSFEDFNHGDSVVVQTHLGNWKKGVVVNTGQKTMSTLYFRRGRSEFKINSSLDHTWIDHTGARVTTDNLQPGFKLHAPMSDTFGDWEYEDVLPDEQLWWCYGFIYGDGTLSKSGDKYYSRVRLCGEKHTYLDRFKEQGFKYSFPPSCDKDPMVYTGEYQKKLPDDHTNLKLIKAFLHGYLSADGAKTIQRGTTRFNTLSTASEEAKDFVCRWLPVFGTYISRVERDIRSTNYGTFDGYRVSFTTYSRSGMLWKLEKISPTTPQNCWCLNVEEDHSFVLENGVTTGNCSFLRVESVYDMVDVLWLLLQGCGVGFSPVVGTLNGFTKPISKIETIRSTRTEKGGAEDNIETWDDATKTWTIKIGDSARAWAKSIGKLLAGKYPADKLVLDFSEIRPAGTRLKGYGWISSGDSALCTAYVAISDILNKKAGCLLSRIDILDIVNWLGTVLSSRRSAEIALFSVDEPEWQEFAVAKKDWWEYDNKHRTQSNNSLVFNHVPSREELEHVFQLMQEAGGSEPGLINGKTGRQRAPWFAGVNPCFTGDMKLLTTDGYLSFQELSGETVEVVKPDGSFSKGKVWCSGTKEVIELRFHGSKDSITCTPDHVFMTTNEEECEAKDLTGKRLMPFMKFKPVSDSEAVKAGFIQGDGACNRLNSSAHRGLEVFFSHKDTEVCDIFNVDYSPRVYLREAKEIGLKYGLQPKDLPERSWPTNLPLQEERDFLQGVYSANGCVILSANRVSLKSTCKEFIDDVRDVLKEIGISSYITTNNAKDVTFSNGTYNCKRSYDLNITGHDNLLLFAQEISFIQSYKKDLLKKVILNTAPKVSTIKPIGEELVYDFSEPDNHWGVVNGVVAHNCGEILLGNKSFCNLVDIDVSKFKGDTPGLLRCIYIMSRANYRQTCVDLRDGILQEAWHLNNEFLRLCGVSLTGIVCREDLCAYDLSTMQRVATNAAYAMADKLGTQRPKNITTIKPSGSVSKIMDCPEGVHKPLGRYIFNNINFSKDDPILPVLKEAGYKVFPSPVDEANDIACIPVRWDNIPFDIVDGKEVNLESALDQLERYRLYQTYWTQQNTSVTISYSPEEVPDIITWLLDNWGCYVGVSFLYRTDPTKTAKDLGYLYLPQEVVTKETYEEYVSKLKPFDLDSINSLEEIVEDGCATGACPVR